MYRAVWTSQAAETYASLKKDARASLQKRQRTKRKKSTPAEGLFKQVHKCVTLLQANPRHPGLQTHAYHALAHPYDPAGKVFEAYVQNRTPGAYQLFWCYGPSQHQITIIAITPHP